MPFCPECKAEYVEGIAECVDCQTALVAELSTEAPEAPEPSASQGGFVTVFEGGNAFDMRMAKGLLESSGFHVELLGGHNPLNPTPTGIQVRADEAEEAKELLESAGDPEDDPSDEFTKDFGSGR